MELLIVKFLLELLGDIIFELLLVILVDLLLIFCFIIVCFEIFDLRLEDNVEFCEEFIGLSMFFVVFVVNVFFWVSWFLNLDSVDKWLYFIVRLDWLSKDLFVLFDVFLLEGLRVFWEVLMIIFSVIKNVLKFLDLAWVWGFFFVRFFVYCY